MNPSILQAFSLKFKNESFNPWSLQALKPWILLASKSQVPPEEAPTPRKPPKVMEGWSFLHFSHFSKDRKKSDPPKAPKQTQDGHLGAIMAHLGRNLLPSWPNFAHLARNFPENSRPSAPKTTNRGPRPIQPTILIDFGSQNGSQEDPGATFSRASPALGFQLDFSSFFR